ncbi:(Fe-S)-binding protein [Pyrobaculum calidifontis]|uniref:Cysteine-rich domain-containing protein n=1 Tax=Pyrobaculum calidifontis (strain DSM 21063 / JCM 11548 / VA1) TaxID=410359 RepID=A3MVI2_PYRCJ|nr:(Fe-S)-binding protein [Pyrobaculum calidifontis]ABO08649.1 conserved hypothetical protein [Pyrobaculum calidifontis JCM 11548]
MIEWLSALRDLLVDNLERSHLPLPVDPGVCKKWREGLSFGGRERVLYTSCMYQMAPLIHKAVELLEKYGAHRGGLRTRVASLGARLLGGILLKPSEEEERRAAAILRSIYSLLKKHGVEFGVLEEEPYSGALLYELGFVDDFAEYAKKVYKRFKEEGVREVITVDPHTQHILEKVYPQFVEGFDISVRSYLDFLDSSKVKVKISGFTIHDSCLYARYLGRYDTVRKLLAAGRPVEDPFITGRETSGCCGGPAESIMPELTRKIAMDRAAKLSKLSRTAVVACPICFVNLSRTGAIEVRDMAEVLE